MAVYYWLNQGRLGNLLFQYAAILSVISQHDRVLSFHNEVFDLLEVDRRFHALLRPGKRARQLSYVINPLASAAARYRLVGCLKEEKVLLLGEYKSSRMVRSSGVTPGLIVVEGFFQDGKLRSTPIKISTAVLDAARARLKSICQAPVTVAVHVRLTDYATWKILGKVGQIVPVNWYRARMSELRTRLAAPGFVIFSDDLAAAKKLDLGEGVVHFEGSSALEDFAAMAACTHAITSPSSFAWWAALANQSDPAKIIMAPTYWAGFRSNTWYPITMETAGIEYYPVG